MNASASTRYKSPVKTAAAALRSARAARAARAAVKLTLTLTLVASSAYAGLTLAQANAPVTKLTTLTLEQLLEVSIVGASKYERKQSSQRLSLNNTRLGGYAVSNLHLVTEALAKGLELSVSLNNLFDKRHTRPAADTNWQNTLDQDGRSARAKASYRF